MDQLKPDLVPAGTRQGFLRATGRCKHSPSGHGLWHFVCLLCGEGETWQRHSTRNSGISCGCFRSIKLSKRRAVEKQFAGDPDRVIAEMTAWQEEFIKVEMERVGKAEEPDVEAELPLEEPHQTPEVVPPVTEEGAEIPAEAVSLPPPSETPRKCRKPRDRRPQAKPSTTVAAGEPQPELPVLLPPAAESSLDDLKTTCAAEPTP